MAKKLLVEIVGDASSLEGALNKSTHAASGFSLSLGHVAKIAGELFAAKEIVGFGVDVVKAAVSGQASQAALNTALKATHQSLEAMSPALEKAQAASRKLGFADDETRTALSRLEVATGSTKKAVSDLSVAQDISRFKHISLTASSQMLAQAMTGSQRAAKQLGITVPAVTTNVEALKASHEKLTTAAGQADLAHAKLLDKMATGQSVIAAVTDKVQGQAKAFSDTAAGGMEQFHAQLEHMKEGLGEALLPALEKVLNWVNTQWPRIDAVFQTVSNAVGQAIAYAKPYLDLFMQAVDRIVERVRADWPQIKQQIETAMNAIKDIITGVVNIVQAIWARFGSTITDIIRRDFGTVVQVVRDAFNIVVGIFQLVGDLLHGRWGKVWDDIKKIVSNALDGVVAIVRTVIQNAYEAALAVGKALAEGVLHGLEGLATSVKNKMADGIHSAIDGVKGLFHIHSPSGVTADEIGAPLGEGVIQGWLLGTVDLPSKMSASVRAAVEQAAKVVQASKATFESAFSGFSSIADQMLSGISSAAQTKAGKQLAGLTAAHDAAGLQQAVIDTQNASSRALAGGDPAEILAADKTLSDALYQQKVAALTLQAAAEQKQLDASNAVKQIAFDKALAALEDHLQKTHASTKTAMTEITKLLSKFGVTFGEVGADMGRAWVEGLKNAIEAAAKGAGALSGTISKQAASINVPHLASGGIVTSPTLALIGEAGPEAVVPLGRGGGGLGGSTINVGPITVNGTADAGFAQMLATQIATQLRAGRAPTLAAAIHNI